jgi:GT2 family glycosyltransferase
VDRRPRRGRGLPGGRGRGRGGGQRRHRGRAGRRDRRRRAGARRRPPAGRRGRCGTVSVVIPNFNGERLLPSCIAALRAQTRPPDEIVVVDNGSRDGSLELLYASGVRVVALPRNLGFAGGANRGIAAASGDLVCVLNSDARPEPRWLERLLDEVARSGDDVWAWGSVLVSAEGLVESAGDHWDDAGYAYKLGRGRPLVELPADPYPVFAPPGAAPLLRRDRVLELGGYEERFFLYYEDVDLAYRALLRGWRAVVVPDARVEHDLGGSGTRARTRFHVARNSLWTAVRCVPEPRTGALAHRVLVELRAKRRPLRLAAVELAGRLAALAGLPRALRERRRIQAQRVLTAAEVRARLEAAGRMTASRSSDAATAHPAPRAQLSAGPSLPTTSTS